MNAGPITCDKQELERTLKILMFPGDVLELRIPTNRHGVVVGYYNDRNAMIRDVVHWSNNCPNGIYFTPNPVVPGLLSRAVNRFKPNARYSTTDDNILERRWLLIDFDPLMKVGESWIKRPTEVSASEEEHLEALFRVQECAEWLEDEFGFKDPIVADSGNGAHLMYRLKEIGVDEKSKEFVHSVLELIAKFMDTDRVKVDPTCCNAARIWKLYGTLAAKGDHTKERPHRISRILEFPKWMLETQSPLLEEKN